MPGFRDGYAGPNVYRREINGDPEETAVAVVPKPPVYTDEKTQNMVLQNYLDALVELQNGKNLEKKKQKLETSKKIKKIRDMALVKTYLKNMCPDAYKEIGQDMPKPYDEENKGQFYAILRKAKRHYRRRFGYSLAVTALSIGGVVAPFYPGIILTLAPILGVSIIAISITTGFISLCSAWIYWFILFCNNDSFTPSV